jgi:MFS family permease
LDEIMGFGGITNKVHVALAGVGFEFAIVLGGILLGGYVDRTKDYKRITLICLLLTALCLLPLGWHRSVVGSLTSSDDDTSSSSTSSSSTSSYTWIVVFALWGLGFVAGPIQPINAELAVDVTYPGDEIAVESVQQIGGNLASALLVPIAKYVARYDFTWKFHTSILSIRGDIVLLIIVTLASLAYFWNFHAPLRRSMADRKDDRNGGGDDDDNDNNGDNDMTSLLLSRTFMSEDISGVELGTTVNQTNIMITMNDTSDNSR